MADKGIFIAENMASTTVGSFLRSGIQATDIENGMVVTLDGLATGEINLYKTKEVAAITDVIYFVDGVELAYDECTVKGLDDIVNVGGKAYRLRKGHVGDIFSVSENMLTALADDKVVVGNVVETPAAGNKLAEKASASATASTVCKVVERWVFGTRAIPMVRLEVIKA